MHQACDAEVDARPEVRLLAVEQDRDAVSHNLGFELPA
jgi:hypothetical protein